MTSLSPRPSPGPRREVRGGRLLRALGVAFLFAAMMCAWAVLLSRNLDRAEQLAKQVPDQNVIVLSADFLEYRDYFRDFPARVSELRTHSFVVEYYKRPLYGPISTTVNIALHALFGVRYPTNLLVILSLYATMAVFLLYAALRRHHLSRSVAALVSFMAASSFSWLSIFSLPESYSLSVCGAVCALLSSSRLRTLDEAGGARRAWQHAILVGILSWIYLPIAGASLLVLSYVRRGRHLFGTVAPTVLATLVVAFLPYLAAGDAVLREQAAYGARWASVANLADVARIGQVLSAFLFFGFVAPVRDFVASSPEVQFSAVFGRPESWLGVMALGVVYALLAVRVVHRRTQWRLVGPGGWLLSLFCFHVLYNPGEVLLYMSVPVCVGAYMVGLAMGSQADIEAGRTGRDGDDVFGHRTYLLLGTLVGLLSLINMRAATGG